MRGWDQEDEGCGSSGDLNVLSLPGPGQESVCKAISLQRLLKPSSSLPRLSLLLPFPSFSIKLTEGPGKKEVVRLGNMWSLLLTMKDYSFSSSVSILQLGKKQRLLNDLQFPRHQNPQQLGTHHILPRAQMLHISNLVKLHFTIRPCKHPKLSSLYTCFMSLNFTQKFYRK